MARPTVLVGANSFSAEHTMGTLQALGSILGQTSNIWSASAWEVLIECCAIKCGCWKCVWKMRGYKRATMLSKLSTLTPLITKLTTGGVGSGNTWDAKYALTQQSPTMVLGLSTCSRHNMHCQDMLKLWERSDQAFNTGNAQKEPQGDMWRG